MTIFISGGCKNGKSSIAEDCCTALAGGGPLYYVATMKPYDDEDRARIKRHIQSRDGKGFITIEEPLDILECLKKSDYKNGTYIVDSITAMAINAMYDGQNDGTANKEALKKLVDDLKTFVSSVKNAVFVSDFIYSENDNYSDYTKDFLEGLSSCDMALAKSCDCVCEIVLGNKIVYKGQLPLKDNQ